MLYREMLSNWVFRYYALGLFLFFNGSNTLFASTEMPSLTASVFGKRVCLEQGAETPANRIKLKSGGFKQKILQKIVQKRLNKWLAKRSALTEKNKRVGQGIVFFILGIAAIIGTVVLALLSESLAVLLLVSILGYALSVFIFTQAYKALSPRMHWRVLLAVFTPIIAALIMLGLAG